MLTINRWILYNYFFAFIPIFIILTFVSWDEKPFTLLPLFQHGESFIISAVLAAELLGKIICSNSERLISKAFAGVGCLCLLGYSSLSYMKIIAGISSNLTNQLIISSIIVLILTFIAGLFTHHSIGE